MSDPTTSVAIGYAQLIIPGRGSIDHQALRAFARLLVIAKRMGVRPRWLDELLAHLGDVLPAGKPRNPAAIVFSHADHEL
jgi:hypothetical protein